MTAHGSSAVGRPLDGSSGTCAADRKGGAALVAGGAGRARVARRVALVFSDVWRVLRVAGDDFADGGAGGWRCLRHARESLIPPGFLDDRGGMPGGDLAARPGHSHGSESVRCPAQRALLHCLCPGNAADRHRPLLSPTLRAGPISRSIRAFTGHISPPAGEPFAIHRSVRTSAEPEIVMHRNRQ